MDPDFVAGVLKQFRQDTHSFKGDFAKMSYKQRANFIQNYYESQAANVTSSIYPKQFIIYHSSSGFLPVWPEIDKEITPSLSVLDIDGKYYGVKSMKVFHLFTCFLLNFFRICFNAKPCVFYVVQ